MKFKNVAMIMLIALFMSCGGKEKKVRSYNPSSVKKEAVKKVEQMVTVDLKNKGIGPIKVVEISSTINQAMADKGKIIFKNKCSSCHKTNRKFIGPNPTGILKIRSPEWVMNMILNPEEMVKNDPIAKELLIKFNGAPKVNQNLSRKEARQVLEYYRTL